MGTTAHDRSDEALLLAAGDEPDAFALFYQRHVRALAAYFWRRSRNAEIAVRGRRAKARVARPVEAARAPGEDGAMTDFYVQLEQQLVAAARRRSERGRMRSALARRARPLWAAAALMAAVVAAVVVALAPLHGDAGVQRRGPAAPVAPPVPAPLLSRDLGGIRVAVLNAWTQPGAARAVAAQLSTLHARIVAVGNAPRQHAATTQVHHGRGARAKALRVAAVLGVARVAPVTSVPPHGRRAEVIVLVGADRSRAP
jgi:hypothetical protein